MMPWWAIDGLDQLLAKYLVEIEIDRRQRDALKVDPAGPGVAHLRESRPRRRKLRRHAIDMGADQLGAVA